MPCGRGRIKCAEGGLLWERWRREEVALGGWGNWDCLLLGGWWGRGEGAVDRGRVGVGGVTGVRQRGCRQGGCRWWGQLGVVLGVLHRRGQRRGLRTRVAGGCWVGDGGLAGLNRLLMIGQGGLVGVNNDIVIVACFDLHA